jgi:citrate lyase subunit beta/citryl-CoA lyase
MLIFSGIVFISILGMLQIGPLKDVLYKGSVSIRGYYWRAGLEMINLPKPARADAVRHAVALIEQAERQNGVNLDGKQPIRILLNIETAHALRTAFDLASAHPRVAGLQLGLADLFEPISVSRKERFAVQYAMMQVKLAAAEAGVDAYDAAFADIKNTEGFQEEAGFAARLGFTGKSCIHPSQVAMANEAFRPSDAAIAHALRILEAAKDADAQGIGAYVVDGKMIDPPFYRSAVKLVEHAKQLGLI